MGSTKELSNFCASVKQNRKIIKGKPCQDRKVKVIGVENIYA